MTIREKGYHRWDGQLKDTGIYWLPIFFNGIKSVFKKKHSRILFSLTLSPFLVFLVGIYVATKPELKMMSKMVRLLNTDTEFFKEFLTNNFSIFMLVILGIFFGAELISGDIKFNSFPLYFSRPMNRKDYILGKLSVIMFYYLLFTLVPGILLYIFKFIFTGKISLDPRIVFGLIFLPLLITLFIAAIVLMVSSLSGNAKYVKIIVFLVYIFSNTIALILVKIFSSDYYYLISIENIIKQMGSFMFNTGAEFHYPPWLSVVTVIVIILGAFFILYKRIGKAEAQIESGS